jgi:hypothetical protein
LPRFYPFKNRKEILYVDTISLRNILSGCLFSKKASDVVKKYFKEFYNSYGVTVELEEKLIFD